MDDRELVKALLPEKVVEMAYDDLVSGPARDLGKVGADIVKTMRLLLVPLQITAAFQDRGRARGCAHRESLSQKIGVSPRPLKSLARLYST